MSIDGLPRPAVDATFLAQRSTIRPVDHGANGQFRANALAQLVATQTGIIWQFRWSSSTKLAVIQRIRIEILQQAAATATITPGWTLSIVRSFTASGSGGTAVSLTGNNNKKKTSHATSLVGDLRSTGATGVAGGLTSGTRTPDGNAIGVVMHQMVITTPNPQSTVWEWDATGGLVHPIVLAQNEGLELAQVITAFGAAGSAWMTIDTEWAEVDSY